MRPGAPSLTISSGSGKPRRRISRKNSRQLACLPWCRAPGATASFCRPPGQSNLPQNLWPEFKARAAGCY
jgi:hypothetical protein